MVNRLKYVMSFLIGSEQSSFVPGRQIMDNIVIYQEVFHSMNKAKGVKGYMALKIDLEKAYDRLNWDFLELVLSNTGFSDAWINNIMKGGPTVSHLMFADHMVLFTEATVEQMGCILKILNDFSLVSGQRINFSKFCIFFSPKITSYLAESLVNMAGMARTDSLGSHLGMPSFHRRMGPTSFREVIDKMKHRLSGWKAFMLSKAGRVIMISSVLNAIPMFLMQTTVLPKYAVGRASWDMKMKNGASMNWRAVCFGLELLRKGISHNVVSGNEILFWTDSWLSIGPLIEFTLVPASHLSLLDKIRNYWIEGVGWNWDVLREVLPQNILSFLQLLTLSNSVEDADGVIWSRNSSRAAFAKSE
ncbi:uncharacterized protein LOC110607253 [Manihot esculenta]|uniref:uncharacterized protein LOC110607253 n=1 Tax=Manihot esculenta TaxID=3983 RepID=UPI000B5D1621|nr:uncharacterized protein LOC110607253 [Manihot esculenta]